MANILRVLVGKSETGNHQNKTVNICWLTKRVAQDWRFVWQRTAKNGKVCFLFSRKIEIFGVEHTCITEYFGGYFFRMCSFFSCILQDFWNVNQNTVACVTFWSKATFNFQTNSFIVCLIQYVCWRWYSHPKRKQMLSLSVRFAQAENEEICKRHKCLLDGDWISAIALWYR